jgi:hypothetical protein
MDSTPPLLSVLSGGLAGVGLGALMAALFYHPGVNRGPTQRIRHLLWCAVLLAMEGIFVAAALGLYQDPGAPGVDQRPLSAGLALGTAVSGGWVVRRRRARARATATTATAAQQPPTPAGTVGSPSMLRTGWRRTHRTLDYAIGMGLCGVALVGGAGLSQSAEPWLTQSAGSVVLALLGLHVLTFLYGQLISNRGLAALNAALRDDWHVRRRSQFILGAGPFLYAIPLSVTSPGLTASLILHVVILWVGYRHTDLPPSGSLKVARQVIKQWRVAHATVGASTANRRL